MIMMIIIIHDRTWRVTIKHHVTCADNKTLYAIIMIDPARMGFANSQKVSRKGSIQLPALALLALEVVRSLSLDFI